MSFLMWHTATPPLDTASDPEVDAVRDTDVAIVADEREAMEDAPPEKSAPPDIDPRVRLGMVTRSTASYVFPTEKYAPPWADNTEVGQVAGDAIPSAGSAAQREMAGDYSHGTMPIVVGIAPLLGNAPSFGAEYFVVHDKPIQDNETATIWGIQPASGGNVGDISGDANYAAQEMIRARHAAETGEGFDLNGLWD